MSRLNAAIVMSLGLMSLVALLIPAPPAFAQSAGGSASEGATPDLADLDFSNAAVSLAGPGSFYIRNIQTADGSYSIRLSAGDDEVWRVAEVYPESANLLPEDVVLDVATVEITEDNSIEIDGVFLEDDVYSVRLRPEDGGYALLDGVRSGTLADIDAERAEPLIDLVVEETVATRLTDARKRIEQLRAARDQAQEEVSRLSARNMGLIERNEELEAENRELGARNADLRETRENLRDEVKTLRTENAALREDIASLNEELQAAQAAAEEAHSAETEVGGGEAGGPESRDAEAARSDAGADAALIERIARQGAEELDGLARTADEIDAGLAEIAATLESLSGDVTANQAEVLEAIAEAQAALVARLAEAEESLIAEIPVPEAPRPSPAPEEREPGVSAEELADRVSERVDERVAERLEPLEEELRSVRSELQEARAELSQPEAPEAGGDSPTARLTEDLRNRIAQLRDRQDRIRREVLDRVAGGRYVETVSAELSRNVTRGFSVSEETAGSGTQLGSWVQEDGSLVQQDPEQYFAKYLLEVPQMPQRTLYRFTAESLDEGWVGLGLHIFVSNVDKRGYGLGDSLLIWFTRDPSVYGTENTFLQVYRSNDDVNMGRVAGAMIAEPIAEPLSASVLYEPDTGYLTVAVNGEDKIRYRAWFDIDRGVQVALRSLGRSRFREFSVSTEPRAD
jgi:small-conductance mechanosensitive channel